MSKCNGIVVAAIQCGSSSFCYGFSSKKKWGRLLTYKWYGGPFISIKAPTCLLLKKDFTESLIGYEAEDKYSGLEDGNNDYHFFKHFTKILRQSVSKLSLSLFFLSKYSFHNNWRKIIIKTHVYNFDLSVGY